MRATRVSDITPKELAAAARRLDAPTFRVWAHIRAARAEDGTWCEEQAQTAQALDASYSTISRAVRALKAAGILSVIRETQRATVYHVAAADGAEDSALPQSPAMGVIGSDKIGYVKLDRSGTRDQSREPDRSTLIGQTSLNTHSVASAVTDQRSKTTVPPPACARVSGNSSGREEKKKTPTDQVTRVAQDARAGGGGVDNVDDSEQFKLLGGLRYLARRRQLAARHSVAEIQAALSIAKKSPGVRDVAAVAASFLEDGTAAREVAEREKRQQRAEATARAASATQPPPFDEFTASQRAMKAVDPQTLAAIVAECKSQLRTEERATLERFISAQKYDGAERTRAEALHWTMRDAVIARLGLKTTGESRTGDTTP